MKASVFIIVLFCVSITTAQSKRVIYEFNLASNSYNCIGCDLDSESNLAYTVQTKDIGLKGIYDLSYSIKTILYQTIVTPLKLSQKEFTTESNLKLSFGKSGLDNYFAYPMTPATAVLGELAQAQKKNGNAPLFNRLLSKVFYMVEALPI
jgi:hypothetical protein